MDPWRIGWVPVSVPLERVVRAVAIPRTDAAGRGVHLAWSGPDPVPLAHAGYEVRRRRVTRRERPRVCADFDRAGIAALERIGMLPDELGTILCRRGSWPRRALALDAAVTTAPVGRRSRAGPALVPGHDETPSDVERPAEPPTRLPATARAAAKATVFTQELDRASDRVFVACTSRSAFAIALSAGKAIGFALVPAGTEAVLAGQAIDTVVVYAIAPSHLRICAEVQPDEEAVEREWAHADVLARGLTLPLREVDQSLADRPGELAKARERLLASETLEDAEADRLAAALRAAAGRDDLGRPCDRVMLSRSETSAPFLETLLTSRIALLTLDPRWRRVLGFGFADTTAVAGETYEYRVSGHFAAADLDDDVYDVHTVPSGTQLPQVVRIRDLALAFPEPATVVLDPPPDSQALEDVSRRAIALREATDPIGFLGGDLLAGLACVVHLPRPCDAVTLEVAQGHDLRCAGAHDGDPFAGPGAPLPAGTSVTLTFPSAVTQLRLSGSGSLYAIRIPSGAGGDRRLARECGPVTFAAQPLPQEPSALAARNLQTPPALLTGPIGEQADVPARSQPGFELVWAPATTSPPGIWPDDLGPGPPLEAIAHQIEHRRVVPGQGADPWEPIHAGENLTFASWPEAGDPPPLGYGADLNEVFPVRRARQPGASVTLSVTDVFGVRDPDGGETRPDAPLGSHHQYRIRAVDVVGRVSGGWTDSNEARLEKRLPPPLPVGPQPPPLPDDGRLTGPVGVRGRALLASDPRLSAADRALLGDRDSAVVLEWGWRTTERELDPLTAEFRVYLQTLPPTQVPGTIANVASGAGSWTVDFVTDRTLAPDECRGQWIRAGETTFKILGHGAGSAIQLTLAASAVAPATAPQAGPASFGRPLAPADQRPGSWQSRVEVVPLTAADSYRAVLFDVCSVDATNRRQTVWVGVSAADAEPYVPDELSAAAPNGARPGNESSIATVAVTAIHRGRPTFSLPPPLGDVPELVTDEPAGRQVRVALDGPTLLGGALSAGDRVALDRCASDAILAITRADANGTITMRRADDSLQTVAFPNPADEAAVQAALASDHPERMPSRYLLFLLGRFDRPDELLQRTGGDLQRLDALSDTVDPRPGRWFYRVRLADEAGAVSVDGAILPLVVRVPSTASPPAPRRVAVATEAGLALTVDVDPDPELRWVLLFAHVSPSDRALDPARAQLLRMPNRRDLYPTDGIRLRLADGTLLAPVAKAVDGPDVVVQPSGALRLAITAPLPAPDALPRLVQHWCYALSRDGIVSRVLGPASVALRGTA